MPVVFNPFTGTFDFTGGSGGGGGTIGGTIAATQIAYGTGADTIGGDAAFTAESHVVTLELPWSLLIGTNVGNTGAPTESSVLFGGDSYAGGAPVQFEKTFTSGELQGLESVWTFTPSIAPTNALAGNYWQAKFGGSVTYADVPYSAVNHFLTAQSLPGVTIPAVVNTFSASIIAGTITSYTDFYADTTQVTGTLTNRFSFYAADQSGVAANVYSFWDDSPGVFRIKADNTFNSVYQAIPALYNPQFTKYTAGTPDYERIVFQWESNVGTLTTEKGGTGTLRALNLGDAGVQVQVNGKNLTLANSFTTSGNFALTLTQTAGTNVTLPTTGTLATLAGSEAFTNKTGNISQWTNDSGYLTSVTAHNLLSATHGDTTAGSVDRGDVITGQGASPKWVRLAKGTANQMLAMDGTATDVVWVTPASGGVTSVALTVPAFLSISGSPVTTSGTLAITLSGTALPVANGGTAATSASITAFNNITGYSAAGATGTTSTNLVFSTSPTLVTPVLGVATATSLAVAQAGGTGTQTLIMNASGPVGFSSTGSTRIDMAFASTSQHTFWSDGSYYQNNTAAETKLGNRVSLFTPAAATLQHGADVNGAAVSQTIATANGITGTDKTGGNLTIASGKGTGAGAVSSLLFQTPTVLGSGTTAQSLATRLTISSAGATFVAGITTIGGATFHTTSSALTDGAAAALGTITNAPAAGNPTKWIGISDNGTIRYIPAW